MVGGTVGIDFGTTNSLVTSIIDGRPTSYTDGNDRPHPSVVWYRGAERIVGRKAREQLDSADGAAPLGLVRSPKMALRRGGAIHLDGRVLAPVDVVAEVLGHLRDDAADRTRGAMARPVERAVFTVPVDFEGKQRRGLREAARKAQIGVVQFVHEPAAALYAYLRAQGDLCRALAEYEGRNLLVFDWGGGTLDLTLCRLLGGTLVQVQSAGDNTIGGDVFDERLRNLIRGRHGTQHGIDDLAAREPPGVSAKLLAQCELAKIALSDPDTQATYVLVGGYLRADGPGADLRMELRRDDVDAATRSLVDKGLALIDGLLESARIDRRDIALCLPTGGMVNMPAIYHGLVERFGGIVRRIPNGERIIAEGAAWIAHDGLSLTLAKPLEVHVADGTTHGHFHPLIPAGQALPPENGTESIPNQQFLCADPRDGKATFRLVKPTTVGAVQPHDDRETLCTLQVPVNANTKPLFERLTCKVMLDHDYIAHITATGHGADGTATAELHRLEFALALGEVAGGTGARAGGTGGRSAGKARVGSASIRSQPEQIAVRPTLISDQSPNPRHAVAGELACRLWPGEETAWQRDEHLYYQPCAACGRTLFALQTEGRVAACLNPARMCDPAAHANKTWGFASSPSG